MTTRLGGLAPLKTSEYDKLLRGWGFVPLDHGGNHPMYLAPNGINKFPISTGKVTQRELRQASKIVGVSRSVFLRGPSKTRPMRTEKVEGDDLVEKAQAHLDEQVAFAEQRAKEKQMAKVIRGRPRGEITNSIIRLFEENPTGKYMQSDVERECGLEKGSAAAPLFRMKNNGIIRQDEKGKPYSLDRRKKQIRTSERRRSTDRARKPEAGPRNGNLRNEILALLEANEGRPMSVDMVVEELGSVRSSTGNALLKLSRAGAIEMLTRGIYRFKMPEHEPEFRSDETVPVFTPQDDEPIDLYPTPDERWGRELDQIEAGMAATPQATVSNGATLWEQMQDLGDHRYLLRDENGQLWVARMTTLEV